MRINMKSKTNRLLCSFLATLLALLGFGACSHGKSITTDGKTISNTNGFLKEKTDTPDIKNMKSERNPPKIRVVYGPPPARFNQNIKK